FRKLLEEFGSPGAARRNSSATLKKTVPAAAAEGIKNISPLIEQKADAACKWAAREGCYILTLADKEYPSALLELNGKNPPPVLYLRGAPGALSERPLVAIVGSRSASPAGVNNTEIFARALSESGVNIVSGMAQGIDSAAHRGALLGKGKTVAVVGTGVDIIYPKQSRTLAAEILRSGGALVGDFPLGVQPLASNFPRRNRIISGLAKGCLVVEATLKSGSLITATLAAEQGREVFAVPGSINAPLHRGCHYLIKNGAKLAENVGDILEELNIKPRARELLPPPPAQGELLNYIDFEPTALDAIAERSGLPASDVLADLLVLEMDGKIVSAAGGGYQRI
ncbi:MAG: DNA-protecting protein DprA, partial [Betaproteobacteria bacterium]|nr:DNA-protecting protein DprA [Betaproteobacteria bacterium]